MTALRGSSSPHGDHPHPIRMSIGSLFSGVGGFELGLGWAGLGPVIWQVEKDPFCRAVLRRHYPEATQFDDVCTVSPADLAPVDLICGGFPCQDLSSAGSGKGLAGSRSGLWREYSRIVAALCPRWVVVENVFGGVPWVDRAVRDLAELHYACLPFPLSARDVGAPHLRKRIFIVAQSDRHPEHGKPFDAEARGPQAASGADPYPDSPGRERTSTEGERTGRSAGHSWRPPIPDVLRMADGFPRRVDRGRCRARIGALGNAVVPQCAEVIGWVIRELEAQP